MGILSTTDKMIYMLTPIKMPLLNIKLPLVAFYIVMPVFVLALQFNLLYIIREYKKQLSRIDKKHPDDIKSLPFGLYEGALFLKGTLSKILKFVLIILLLVLPPFILASFWFRFADFQNLTISNLEFVFILISLAISLYFSDILIKKSKKNNIIKIIISLMFILSITFYQLFVIVPFASRDISFSKVKNVYKFIESIDNKEIEGTLRIFGINNLREWFLPILIVKSELLIPVDKEKLELLKNLNTSKKQKSLLLYSLPFDRSHRNFKFADFSHSIMIHTNFYEANLQGSELNDAHLEGSYLDYVHLEGSNLWGAHLEGSHLWGAHLEGSHLISAHLEGTHLRGAQLEGSHLRGAHLEGSDLSDAHLEGSDLGYVHLEGSDLSYAHLEGSDLRDAHLEGSDLSYAHLEGSDLGYVHLEGSDLRGADLEGSNLSGAHLEGSNLWKAKLQGSFLLVTNLKSVVTKKKFSPFIKNIKYSTDLENIDRSKLTKKEVVKLVNIIKPYKNNINGFKQQLSQAIGIDPLKWIYSQWVIAGKLTPKEIEEINKSITNPKARKFMGLPPVEKGLK
ncbi:pentapeptide repeat-containing protein [Caminibacter sp.]